MTILLFKTILLLALLTVGGAGLTIWFAERLRLNFLLLLGFSFVIGVGLYAASVTSLLLKGGFAQSDLVAWLFGLLGLLSSGLALYRGRWKLLKTLAPSRAALALLVLSLSIAAPVVVHAVLLPLTSWDAKMIWMVKAKALYVEPHVPNTLFASDLFTSTHKDYPIGLPALVAAHYNWFGGVSEQPVALTYVAFWWIMLVLVAGALERVIGKDKPYRVFGIATGLMLLLSAGNALQYAGLGLADVPLASFFLVATTTLLFATTDIQRSGSGIKAAWLWLSLGLLAALLGANVKNEGASFLVLFGLVAGASLLLMRRAQRADHKRQGIIWTLTALLPLVAISALPLILWRTVQKTQGYRVDLFLPINRTVQFYMDRVIDVWHWFVLELGSVEHWGWALLPMVALATGVIVWWRSQGRPWVGLAALVLIAGQVGAYFLIYVTTPHDLTWHITTSLDRVLLHIVPALYLVVTSLVLLLSSRAKPESLAKKS